MSIKHEHQFANSSKQDLKFCLKCGCLSYKNIPGKVLDLSSNSKIGATIDQMNIDPLSFKFHPGSSTVNYMESSHINYLKIKNYGIKKIKNLTNTFHLTKVVLYKAINYLNCIYIINIGGQSNTGNLNKNTTTNNGMVNISSNTSGSSMFCLNSTNSVCSSSTQNSVPTQNTKNTSQNENITLINQLSKQINNNNNNINNINNTKNKQSNKSIKEISQNNIFNARNSLPFAKENKLNIPKPSVDDIENIAAICLFLAIEFNECCNSSSSNILNEISTKTNLNSKTNQTIFKEQQSELREFYLHIRKTVKNFKYLEMMCLKWLNYDLGIYSSYDYLILFFKLGFIFEDTNTLNMKEEFEKCLKILDFMTNSVKSCDFSQYILAMCIIKRCFENNKYFNEKTFKYIYGVDFSRQKYTACLYLIKYVEQFYIQKLKKNIIVETNNPLNSTQLNIINSNINNINNNNINNISNITTNNNLFNISILTVDPTYNFYLFNSADYLYDHFNNLKNRLTSYNNNNNEINNTNEINSNNNNNFIQYNNNLNNNTNIISSNINSNLNNNANNLINNYKEDYISNNFNNYNNIIINKNYLNNCSTIKDNNPIIKNKNNIITTTSNNINENNINRNINSNNNIITLDLQKQMQQFLGTQYSNSTNEFSDTRSS